jgi:hypothetical protein
MYLGCGQLFGRWETSVEQVRPRRAPSEEDPANSSGQVMALRPTECGPTAMKRAMSVH